MWTTANAKDLMVFSRLGQLYMKYKANPAMVAWLAKASVFHSVNLAP